MNHDLLDLAAIAAMQSYTASDADGHMTYDDVATCAYTQAAAMLKARQRHHEQRQQRIAKGEQA